MSLRILLTSHYALPHLGGIEVVVDAQARELAARGHEVVHVASVPGGIEDRGAARPYRLVRVPAFNGLEDRLHVPFPVFAPVLARVLHREVARAHVVHAHGFLYMTSAIALPLARRAGKVRVLSEHVGHVDYASPVLDRIEALAIGTLGRATVEAAQALVTMNPKVAGELQALGGERPVEMIDNGVDTAAYRPAEGEERAALRAALGWDERPRVLFVGRLVAKKGVDLAIAAAGLAGGRFELVMVGPGTPPAAPPESVRLLGPLEPARVAELYRAADAFLLPSRGEGFPVTAQEAMASGLPVVLADDPAYAPHVSGAGEGVRLVEPAPAALVAALDSVLADEAARRRAGEAAAAHARRTFSWSHAVDRYEELYARLSAVDQIV